MHVSCVIKNKNMNAHKPQSLQEKPTAKDPPEDSNRTSGNMQKTQYKQGHKAYTLASSEASNEFSQKSQLIAQLERNGHITVKARGVALENLTIIKQGKRSFQ